MNKFQDNEVEAIALLQAGNPQAFKVMVSYFTRQYDSERTKCVDDNIDTVGEHRGKAKAWRDAKDILKDAQNVLNS